MRPESQHLTIALRADGDVQVEYHVAGKDGSPFEALFVMVDGEEREIVDEVAGFVADLIEERLVLARDSSWFRGGRRFLAPSAIGGEALRRLDWVTSWRGTHDWRL